jgi:hypothetical protein
MLKFDATNYSKQTGFFGFDVNHESVIKALHQLADTIEQNKIILISIATSQEATVEDYSMEELRIKFAAKHDNEIHYNPFPSDK